MSETTSETASATPMFDDTWVALELDEDLYPRDAVHGAAYVFLERAYLFLERAGDAGDANGGRLRVRLRAKAGLGTASAALAGEFENEALAQAYRRRIAEGNRVLIESITSRALAGAAGPPGLDDLLAMDIGAETAFDDPLGIAMSWEEKYKKKSDKAAEEPQSPVIAPVIEATSQAEPEKDPV
jgi:His-Xaa-Ser system protein HxsD